MATQSARTVDTSPYWLESVSLPRFPKLDRDAGADVVVVGGGITGLTAGVSPGRELGGPVVGARARPVRSRSTAATRALT